MSARLTIMGLLEADPDLFENMVLPAAADLTDDAATIANPWEPDDGLVVASIVMQCADLEVIYPSPPTMKTMIGIWSAMHFSEWCGLYNTMIYKYNPIWNKDGTWKETRDLDGKNDRTAGLTITDTRTYTALKDEHTFTNFQNEHSYTNLTDEHSLTNLKNIRTGSVQHDVTGYDSNTYSADTKDTYNDVTDTGNGSEKNVKNGSEKNVQTGSEAYTRTGEDKNVQTVQGTDKYYTEDNGTITREEQGNIGVTSTQELIQKQREIVQFNFYDHIAQSFKHNFCVMVY